MLPDLYILDAHTLLWFLDGNQKLGRRVAQILNDQSTQFLLPAIALAEALFVLEKGRTPYTITEQELLDASGDDARIKIFPLTDEVITTTLACKAIPEMHDRQIVATALVAQRAGAQVTILTRDRNISQSRLIPALW